MIYDNLKQGSLTIGTSKLRMNENYQVTWVDGINLTYMRNFNMNSITLSLSRMKPLGKWGTVGVGISYSYMFGKDNFGEDMLKMWSLGYNFLLLNMVKVNERIVYSHQLYFDTNHQFLIQKRWMGLIF